MSSTQRQWFKHGFLNTIEHAVTRFSDAGLSLVLIWALSPENFGKLALAQAWVAPMLLFFISPETVLYRDYSKWKDEGRTAFSARLKALRLMGWAKAQAALIISVIGMFFLPLGESSLWIRFSILLWAFSFTIAPQIGGADREFLRVGLRLRELNIVSLFQKLSLLLVTITVGLFYPSRFEFLAAGSVFSALSSAFLARFFALRALRAMPDREIKGLPDPMSTLLESFQTFAIWNHLAGVCNNWVLTLDLFCLGLVFTGHVSSPASIGLYAIALKIANFSLALPTALTNFFMVWIGHQKPAHSGNSWVREELTQVKKLGLQVAGAAALQNLVLWLVSPFILNLLSHGRWTPDEQLAIQNWLKWILLGTTLYIAALVPAYWMIVRGQVRKLTVQVYIPWLVSAFAIYCGVAGYMRAEASQYSEIPLNWLAMANVVVGALFPGLVIQFIGRIKRTS